MSVETILHQAINQKIFPGGVVGFCSPEEHFFWSCGTLDYVAASAAVTPQTLYDLASLTKTIPTACIIWKLVELRKISLEDRVQSFLPEWHGTYKEEVRIWHLLAQAVRYENVALSSLKDLPREALVQRILELEIIEPPGSSYYYVNTSSILLTWILERVTGRSLNDLSRQYLWKPAQMEETSFSPQLLKNMIAPTELDPQTGEYLQGTVHDESARTLSAHGSSVGSAGLFSSASDLLKFLQTLLRNDGTLFSHDTVEQLFTPRTLAHGQKVALGWELNASWMGPTQTECYGKTGFTGCCIAVLPRTKKAMVFLSNAVHPHRPTDRSEITKIRSECIQSLQNFSFSQNL